VKALLLAEVAFVDSSLDGPDPTKKSGHDRLRVFFGSFSCCIQPFEPAIGEVNDHGV